MLTKNDLNQIKTIVEEVVEQKLEQKFEEKLQPIHKTMKKMQKDIKDSFDFADRNYLDHEKRIRKIEARIQISDSFSM